MKICRFIPIILAFFIVFILFSFFTTASAAISNGTVSGNAASDLVVGKTSANYNVSFTTNVSNTATSVTVTFPANYSITNGEIGTSTTTICDSTCSNNGKITVGASDVNVSIVNGSTTARTLTLTLATSTNLSARTTSFRFLLGIQNATTSGITATSSITTNATGETATSTSGVTLTAGTATKLVFTTNPSANMFVATGIGTTSSIAYSYDGINWIGENNAAISTTTYRTVWNGTIWVAFGRGVNTLFYSSDGLNWTAVTSSINIFSPNAVDAAWNGSIWVAAGQGNNSLAYSYDGMNWIGLGKSIFSSYCDTVNWNGTIWVAIGAGTNTLAYSYDGINWTGLGTSIFSEYGLDIHWNNAMWVATGGEISLSSTTNTLAYSYDGINWTGLGTNTFSKASQTIYYGYELFWDNSRNMWFATGYQTSSTLAYSYDGINWTNLGNSLFSVTGYFIDCNNTICVGAGKTNNTLAYSYDGITWTGLGATIFSNYGRPYWDGSRWLATGMGANGLAYSSDGVNWTGLGNTIFSSRGYYITSTNIAPNGDIRSGLAFNKQPVIAAEDQYGNIDTTHAGTVTLSATGSGTFSGTLTEAFSSGVADFTGNGVKYSAKADQETFTLTASDGSFSTTTASFISDVVATKLVFTTQPSDAVAGIKMASQPVVVAEDNNGLTDTDFREVVALSSATNNGAVTTNATSTAVNGVATFTNAAYTPSTDFQGFKLKASFTPYPYSDGSRVIGSSSYLINPISPAESNSFTGNFNKGAWLIVGGERVDYNNAPAQTSVVGGGALSLSSTVLSNIPATPVIPTIPPIPSYSFTRNLDIGSKGTDVKQLQQFLNNNGFIVNANPKGPGSPGHETFIFGYATQAALKRFQKSNGISPVYGYFGPKTRAYLKGKGF